MATLHYTHARVFDATRHDVGLGDAYYAHRADLQFALTEEGHLVVARTPLNRPDTPCRTDRDTTVQHGPLLSPERAAQLLAVLEAREALPKMEEDCIKGLKADSFF